MESLERLKQKIIRSGADDTALTKNKVKNSLIKFVNNKIVNNTLSDSNNISIFIAKDKKLVTTSVKDISDKNISKLIEKLLAFIKHIKPNPNYNGIAKGPFEYPNIPDTYDKKVEDFDSIDYVKKGINAALENSKRTSGTFVSQIVESDLVSSNDVKANEKSSSLYFSIRAFSAKEASGHQVSCSRVLDKFDPEKAGRKAGEISKMSLNPENVNPGSYNVVFDHLPISNLFSYIIDAASIFSVEAGLSFLTDKLNKKIGNFTLIDDATFPNGLGSTSFDEEGHPTKKNTIMDKGILKTFLHNTSSAQRYNVENTANAGIISPRPWNTVLEGKTGNPFDVKKGIYITNTWYTRFQNYTLGDFSTIPRDGAFLIKDGEITTPLKNLRISDNMLNILKNISTVSKEKEQIKAWDVESPIITPKVLIKNVNITRPTI